MPHLNSLRSALDPILESLAEIDLCLALEGSPTFDGRPPGWLVLPPGSRHVPTVTGGDMAILYFLPDGAITFHGT